FFFQAEDGIRDFHVTGVQTCALPIFARTRTRGRARICPDAWLWSGFRRRLPHQLHEGDRGGNVVRARVRLIGPSRLRMLVVGVRSEERRVGKEGRWWGTA